MAVAEKLPRQTCAAMSYMQFSQQPPKINIPTATAFADSSRNFPKVQYQLHFLGVLVYLCVCVWVGANRCISVTRCTFSQCPLPPSFFSAGCICLLPHKSTNMPDRAAAQKMLPIGLLRVAVRVCHAFRAEYSHPHPHGWLADRHVFHLKRNMSGIRFVLGSCLGLLRRDL